MVHKTSTESLFGSFQFSQTFCPVSISQNIHGASIDTFSFLKLFDPSQRHKTSAKLLFGSIQFSQTFWPVSVSHDTHRAFIADFHGWSKMRKGIHVLYKPTNQIYSVNIAYIALHNLSLLKW